MAKYFGTDGIRGVVNENLNFTLAYNVGKSLAVFLRKQDKTKTVIIGNHVLIMFFIFQDQRRKKRNIYILIILKKKVIRKKR